MHNVNTGDTSMDKQVKSVLNISHFVFDEISFTRKGFRQSDSGQVPFEVGTSVKKTEANNYIVTLVLKVEKTNEYTAKVQISGYCEIDENEPNKDVLLNENAPAILYPYARAQMTMLTAQPETTPLVLPVINMHAMRQNAKEVKPEPVSNG